MALRIDSDPAQSFFATFELQGDAQRGQLSLFSPLGATLAQLTWSPAEARLRAQGQDQAFDSLDALTRNAVGTELPVAGIFAWLGGKTASPEGWEADLREHARGRVTARRLVPAPAVEMRLLLD